MDVFLLLAGALSFFTGLWLIPWLAKEFKAHGVVGIDRHTGEKVAEMGGLGILLAFLPGVMFMLFLHVYVNYPFPVMPVLTALLVALILTILGVVDDLIALPKLPKAILPMFAAVPLIVLRQATPVMVLPFIGRINLGAFYLFAIVPVAITVAANLANMVEGVNGLGSGLAIIYYSTLLILSLMRGNHIIPIVFMPFLGALLAFFLYNRPPARIFPGDTGTYLMGGLFAATAIAGNFETPAGLLFLPLVIDFVIKALNGFPSKGWWAKRRGELLYYDERPRHILQLVLKLFGPMSQTRLLVYLLVPEVLTALMVFALYIL